MDAPFAPAAATSRARARVAGMVFLLAVVLSAWRFYRLRSYLEFVDESAEVVSAWLVSEGETLYGSVFSHHMPLAVIAGHLVAALSPSDHFAHFRSVPWLAYVLVALAIATSPFERKWHAGVIAASLFLLAATALAPMVHGHLLLGDLLWGLSFVVLSVRFLLPLLAGISVGRHDAFLGGMSAVLALAGALVAAYPLAIAGVLCAVGLVTRERRREARSLVLFFLLGGATTSLALFLWIRAFGSPSRFFEEAVQFNRDVYVKFLYPQGSQAEILRRLLDDWLGYMKAVFSAAAFQELGPYFVLLALLTVFAIAAFFRPVSTDPFQSRRRFLLQLILGTLLVVTLRMRRETFHSSPYYLFILSTLSVVAAISLAERRFVRAGLLAGIVLVPLGVAAVRHESFSFNSSQIATGGLFGDIAVYIRDHTSPGERIAVFPTMPFVYLEAKRHPATDSIYLFPWQIKWESRHPMRPDTCAQLRSARPRFVVMWAINLWDHFQWEKYAACEDSWVKAHYRRVDASRFQGLLWELSEAPLGESYAGDR